MKRSQQRRRARRVLRRARTEQRLIAKYGRQGAHWLQGMPVLMRSLGDGQYLTRRDRYGNEITLPAGENLFGKRPVRS